MKMISVEAWKEDMKIFQEAAKKYYAGELKRAEYKGISGKYGSYAQNGDEPKSMLRLRMPAGRLTKEKLAFIAGEVRRYKVDKLKFTTCQTVQLHNLDLEPVCRIMEDALGAGIVTVGGGGDFPRNVTCSPLSGVDADEYFDVMPYAEAAGQYAMQFINEEKMPRKYKIGFSSSPKNQSHATMRDLGFFARPDGRFDVYSAGGIGPNPRVGVKVGEAVEPEDILKYVRAMWVMFRTYGNYKLRARARSRYMQEDLGGPDKYCEAFQEKLAEVEGTDDFSFEVHERVVAKAGSGTLEHRRAAAQKQPGLYSVVWHPLGGCPSPEVLCRVSDALQDIEEAEIRLAPDETAYIVNLTAKEAEKLIELTAGDSAASLFEMASACIGGSICQQGVRDSQALLKKCVEAVQKAGIPDGALPAIHISGCPGSCATPQVVPLGFRGAVRDKQPAWMLYLNGCDIQGQEVFGREAGVILETRVPEFLVELGKTVAESGRSFAEWVKEQPDGVEKAAARYI